jgi:16S rRNA (adenine1518-N6/adenine1519-N6)-dimethyltransferase
MARQPLGQHFLVSGTWRARVSEELATPADRLADACSGACGDMDAGLPADARANIPWVEIGAGHGEMTAELATIGARAGSRVIAIETDARLAAQLRAKKIPGVEVVHADVLTADLAALAGGHFRVYGNLPYYITSPILHHLLENFRACIRDIHIVIQWEVAERIAAAPGGRAYGYLSAFCQFHARPEILFRIPSSAFLPPPKVSSALMRLTLPGEGDLLGISAADVPAFFSLVKTCFAHKRKNLRNNLRGIGPDAAVAEALSAAQIPPTARAEQIPLSEMAVLFTALGSKSGTTEYPAV